MAGVSGDDGVQKNPRKIAADSTTKDGQCRILPSRYLCTKSTAADTFGRVAAGKAYVAEDDDHAADVTGYADLNLDDDCNCNDHYADGSAERAIEECIERPSKGN